jgi:hypothetical protein
MCIQSNVRMRLIALEIQTNQPSLFFLNSPPLFFCLSSASMGNIQLCLSTQQPSNQDLPVPIEMPQCHQRLAQVEVHLICHFLDACSLVRLARCSRRWLQDCTHAFAWKYCSISYYASGLQKHADRADRRYCLIRLCPIELNLSDYADLSEIPTCYDIRGLFYRYVYDLPMDRVSHSVQRLSIHHPVCPSLFAKICTALTELTSVTLNMRVDGEKKMELELLSCLPSLPQLTHLHVNFTIDTLKKEATPLSTPVQSIAECIHLRKLHLTGPRFSSNAFASLFTAESLQQLQDLTLESCALSVGKRISSFEQGPSHDECVEVFRNLVSLHSLTLDKVWGVNTVLPHLVHASSLRHVHIQSVPDPRTGVPWIGTRIPHAAALHALKLTSLNRIQISTTS